MKLIFRDQMFWATNVVEDGVQKLNIRAIHSRHQHIISIIQILYIIDDTEYINIFIYITEVGIIQ